ncbi:alpha-amylase family glycosyl hydrolase [Arcanobacterium hippocoleae]
MNKILIHHDASDLYLTKESVANGWNLKIRLRCGTDLPIDHVLLRTLIDGEPSFTRGERIANEGIGMSGQWWEVNVFTKLPHFTYRWLITFENKEMLWLNAEGIWNRTIPDHADFSARLTGLAPLAHLQSSVYQIFPDRFARSAQTQVRGLPAWSAGWLGENPSEWDEDAAQTKLFGGDLWGVIEHLDYIQEMGFDTIYSTPFFEARSSHRYDAHSFEHVDPNLGGDEALIALIEACHQRGMRFLGDLTTNHTG